MKLKFIFLGRKNPESLNFIMEKYLKRLNHYVKSELFFINEKDEIKLEKKLQSRINKTDYLIVLDENGEMTTTLEYSKIIHKQSLIYDTIIFIVGGAYGVPKKIIHKSNYLLALSKMTFPHLIARLILLEQTYRAFTILNHHPYHHE